MKKHFLVLTTAIVSFVIVSCSKEKTETDQSISNPAVEQAASPNATAERLVVDPLLVNLDGRFEFNGNLKDETKKLADGTIVNYRGALYTYDRKGVAKAAIKFNGNYGVNLFNVPQQTHGSISVWVKYDNPNLGTGRMIVKPKKIGLGVGKFMTEMEGSVEWLPNYSMGIHVEPVDKNWHHFVVTFDDDILRLYEDGQLVKYNASTLTYPKVLQDYFVGYRNNEWFEGAVDDLRFYSRTLSATDVQKLYNL
jgi:hypothetical protein